MIRKHGTGKIIQDIKKGAKDKNWSKEDEKELEEENKK